MRVDGAEQARADAQRNRAAILDAAADVLAVQPSASLSEVATRAGLGRATLYRHFENREALRAAIREEALARAAIALAEADLDSCPTREGIRRAASVLVPLGMRFRILLTEGADADPDFLAARDQVLRPLWELLGRAVEAGDLDPRADPRWLGMVLAGLLTSAVRSAADGIITPADAGDLVCQALLDGFASDRAR
jgi:TetR/AcrR family transcriptional repressor of mexCD-oprJ operon